MPVRSLTSSVLTWPDRETVDRSLRQWVERAVRQHPDVVRIGYFGSYASGNWGVGSDLDLVAVVGASDRPFIRRGADWDTTDLPVPADLLVYTEEEWNTLVSEARRFARQAVNWVYAPVPSSSAG